MAVRNTGIPARAPDYACPRRDGAELAPPPFGSEWLLTTSGLLRSVKRERGVNRAGRRPFLTALFTAPNHSSAPAFRTVEDGVRRSERIRLQSRSGARRLPA
jgi:hypothetical protein